LDAAKKTLDKDPDQMEIEVGHVTAMAEVMHEGDAAFQENIFKVLHDEIEYKIEMLEKEMKAEIDGAQDPVERSGKETELATRKREIVSEYRGLFTTVASYYTFPLPQEIEQDMKAHEDEAYEAEGKAEADEDLTKMKEGIKGAIGLGYDPQDPLYTDDGEPKMPGPNDRRCRY
jgi:hypothetical protein